MDLGLSALSFPLTVGALCILGAAILAIHRLSRPTSTFPYGALGGVLLLAGTLCIGLSVAANLWIGSIAAFEDGCTGDVYEDAVEGTGVVILRCSNASDERMILPRDGILDLGDRIGAFDRSSFGPATSP